MNSGNSAVVQSVTRFPQISSRLLHSAFLVCELIYTYLSLHLYLCVCVCVRNSAKFSSKIKYVNSLDELQELIPMESIQIPECIIR